MNNYGILFSDEAFSDLREIYEYIAFELKETSLAKKQVNRIRKEIASLNSMPKRYRTVEWEPWKSMELRRLNVDNYSIFYLVREENLTVDIVHIFYGKRDIQAHL